MVITCLRSLPSASRMVTTSTLSLLLPAWMAIIFPLTSMFRVIGYYIPLSLLSAVWMVITSHSHLHRMSGWFSYLHSHFRRLFRWLLHLHLHSIGIWMIIISPASIPSAVWVFIMSKWFSYHHSHFRRLFRWLLHLHHHFIGIWMVIISPVSLPSAIWMAITSPLSFISAV